MEEEENHKDTKSTKNSKSSFIIIYRFSTFVDFRNLIFIGYGEDLGDKDTDLSVALNDHNRKYYLQRHLLALNEAIW